MSPFLGLTEMDEEDVRAKSDRAVSGLTEWVDVLRRWQGNQKERATYRWVDRDGGLASEWTLLCHDLFIGGH